MKTNKSIYKLILEGNDIGWQTVIYELVRTNKVDPWDLDISTLSREFIKILRNLERMNFHLSGRVVMAAAILLKLKTRELGLSEFVDLAEYASSDAPAEEESEIQDAEEQALVELAQQTAVSQPRVEAKVPGPRIRPVTVIELVSALKRAIDVEERRQVRHEEKVERMKPQKHKINKIDIQKKILTMYAKIRELTLSLDRRQVEFGELLPKSAEVTKTDKVWTFVPLLHLANDEKVNLHQELPFSKIFIEFKE